MFEAGSRRMPKFRLSTLEEMEEMEKMNGGELADAYNRAYIGFLRQGMPRILSHLEAVAVKHEGEEHLCDNLRNRLIQERGEYKKKLANLS